MHQTVIGPEAKKQLALAEDEADIVIGCAGVAPTSPALLSLCSGQLQGLKPSLRIIAVELYSLPVYH